jgi:hypothetical protein
VLYSTISLILSTSTTIMPQVESGGNIVVESRKNGHVFRGIIWWDYLVGSREFSHPPARPPVDVPPRVPPRALGSGHPALGSGHPAPRCGAPFATRSLFPCRR